MYSHSVLSKVISSSDVLLYTKCPRRYFLSTKLIIPSSPKEVAITKLIQATYIYHIKHGKLAAWKSIRKWAEHFIAKEHESYSGFNLLAIMSMWYEKFYLPLHCDQGLTNLPLIINLGQYLTFRDSIPLVTIGKEILLFDFKATDNYADYSGLNIYNDLLARIKIWTFHKSTNLKVVKYIRWTIGDIHIKPVFINITDKIISDIEPTLRHIASGIKDQIFYQSFSEQCYTCPYKAECLI